MDAVLDFVGDVGDHLDGFAEVFAFALVVEHGLINLAAGEVVEPGELDVGEPLVMAQVQVGLRAVVQHINLAVLVGVHGAGVHVEVRVELLQRDLEAAVFQQGAQRGGRQALAQRTHHAAGDKYEFHFKSVFQPQLEHRLIRLRIKATKRWNRRNRNIASKR